MPPNGSRLSCGEFKHFNRYKPVREDAIDEVPLRLHALPNGSRLSCGTQFECSQTKVSHTVGHRSWDLSRPGAARFKRVLGRVRSKGFILPL